MAALEELIEPSDNYLSPSSSNRRNIIIGTIYTIGIVSLIGSVVLYVNYLQKEDSTHIIETKTQDINITKSKIIDISGSVITPGVYTLGMGARVGEAITLAGGLSPTADLEWVEKNLNLASVIADGQKLYIPSENSPSKSGADTSASKININIATVEQLDSIPGVSTSLASKIIDYRQQQGQFQSAEELLNVPGIGEATLAKIKPYVLVP